MIWDYYRVSDLIVSNLGELMSRASLEGAGQKADGVAHHNKLRYSPTFFITTLRGARGGMRCHVGIKRGFKNGTQMYYDSRNYWCK